MREWGVNGEVSVSIWLDKKYIQYASVQLEMFKWKQGTVANFRCPLCGDSARVKTRTRGYLFSHNNTFLYKCFNCSISLPFSAFLKKLDRRLYNEYALERLQEHQQRRDANEETAVTPVPRNLEIPEHIYPLHTTAPVVREVRTFIERRKITTLDRLYGTKRAFSSIATLVGSEKASKLVDDVPYLVLPLTLPSGEWYGAQFRAIHKKEYITFRWNETVLMRMFGLSHWAQTDTTYIVEGPLDSLLIPNALAACGSDLLNAVTEVDRVYGLPPGRRVLVWDNETRNEAVVKALRRAIAQGEQVFIWPSGYPKDINDALLNGVPVTLELLRTHTYCGLRADLEFQRWKRRG